MLITIRSPGYPQLLSNLASNPRFPSGLVDFLLQLTKLRETLKFTSLLKDMIKDTDEQSDEEEFMSRSGRVLSIWSLEDAVHRPSGVDVFANMEAAQNPCYWDFYGAFVQLA